MRFLLGLLLLKANYYLNMLARICKHTLLAILLPRDLVRLNKSAYANKPNVDSLSSSARKGLDEMENNVVRAYCRAPARFLVLGCGAGRETYDLAKRGFDVTGIDFVEELLNKAGRVVEEEKLDIKYINKDILLWASQKSEGLYDYILLSSNVYLQIPTRKLRINFIKGAFKKLSPAGLFLIMNNCVFNADYNNKVFKYKKILARLSFGNSQIEPGDRMPARQFLHRPKKRRGAYC